MTAGQLELLAALTDGPLRARRVADSHGRSYDGARHALRRLEDHGLVRRIYLRPGQAEWELTQAGRDQLQHAT